MDAKRRLVYRSKRSLQTVNPDDPQDSFWFWFGKANGATILWCNSGGLKGGGTGGNDDNGGNGGNDGSGCNGGNGGNGNQNNNGKAKVCPAFNAAGVCFAPGCRLAHPEHGSGNGRGGGAWGWLNGSLVQIQAQQSYSPVGNEQHTGKGGGKGGGRGSGGKGLPNPRDEGVLWERDGSVKRFRRIPVDQPCPFIRGGGRGCFAMRNRGTCNRVHADCPEHTGLNYKPKWDL
jgi:hypothetical protein